MDNLFVVACDSVPGGIPVREWSGSLATTLRRYHSASLAVFRTPHQPTEEVGATLFQELTVAEYPMCLAGRGHGLVQGMLEAVQAREAESAVIVLTDRQTAREFVVAYIRQKFESFPVAGFRPSDSSSGEVYALRCQQQILQNVYLELAPVE